MSKDLPCQSQWPRGLRRGSADARLLRSWVRIPTGTWLFVCWECCVLSGRGLCDELITRAEETYRLWCVFVCDLETSWMRRPCPTGGGWLLRQNKQITCTIHCVATQRNTDLIFFAAEARNHVLLARRKIAVRRVSSSDVEMRYTGEQLTLGVRNRSLWLRDGPKASWGSEVHIFWKAWHILNIV